MADWFLRPRTLAFIALSAGVVFAVLTVWVVVAGALPYDRRILAVVHDVVGTDLDEPARILTRAATAWVLVPVFVIVALSFVAKKDWKDASLVVGAAVLVWAVNPTVKQLVGRERPSVRPFIEPVSEYSFPSGHASAAMVAAVVAAMLASSSRWRRVVVALVFAYVIVIAIAQVVLGVHYPSDLIASWALAIAGMAALAAALHRLSP
jgi:undecaprenyl-diphosphatase